jgi:hypothetical protein
MKCRGSLEVILRRSKWLKDWRPSTSNTPHYKIQGISELKPDIIEKSMISRGMGFANFSMARFTVKGLPVDQEQALYHQDHRPQMALDKDLRQPNAWIV